MSVFETIPMAILLGEFDFLAPPHRPLPLLSYTGPWYSYICLPTVGT